MECKPSEWLAPFGIMWDQLRDHLKLLERGGNMVLRGLREALNRNENKKSNSTRAQQSMNLINCKYAPPIYLPIIFTQSNCVFNPKIRFPLPFRLKAN